MQRKVGFALYTVTPKSQSGQQIFGSSYRQPNLEAGILGLAAHVDASDMFLHHGVGQRQTQAGMRYAW
jgi:hypothetical protein